MKQITFIRHAKSNHIMGLRDHDRPLNDRGFIDAPSMAKRLRAEDFHPDVFFTSTALRAQTTAELIRNGIDIEIPLEEHALLYHAFINDYTAFIHQVEDSHQHIVIVGHNPTITLMVNLLARDNVTESMPTCCIVSLAFEDCTSWNAISPHSGTITRHAFPGQ
jgi:phosphohistidine phosphatase